MALTGGVSQEDSFLQTGERNKAQDGAHNIRQNAGQSTKQNAGQNEKQSREQTGDNSLRGISGTPRQAASVRRKEYARRKALLPCFTLCRCEGGHAASDIREYYGLVPLDFDHLLSGRIELLQSRAQECPHTLSVFRTPSGQGLRIIVPTGCTDPGLHLACWQRAREHYEALLGVPADEATKDPSRVSYVSYDPQAWWNPQALPLELSTQDAFPGSGAPVAGSREKEAPCGGAPRHPSVADFLPASPQEKVSEYSPLARCRHRLEYHLLRYPYPSEGEGRNTYLFRFSLRQRGTGVTEWELAALLISHFAVGTLTSKEISQLVHSAFRAEYGGEVSPGVKVSPIRASGCVDSSGEESEEFENPSGEELRECTPCLCRGEEERLPRVISCNLFPFTDVRQKDVLLLTLITSLGACMHRATGVYGRRRVWPSLYTFVVAPAASGKGIMRWAEEVVTPYCDSVLEESMQLHQEWKELMRQWEDRREMGRRERRNLEEEPPEEPPVRSILVPSTLSRARLIDHVLKNQPYGSLIIDSEADSLSTANRADFGQFDHLLRKFFEHEKTATSFKVDGGMKVIRNPCLSLSLTGTPSQLAGLITNYENGLQSRFLEYTFRHPLPRWEDMSPWGEYSDLGAYYARQGARVKEMLEWINRAPMRVTLDRSQWMRLNRTFRDLLRQASLEEDSQLQAAVKRHGLMAFRVMIILSCCRAWEERRGSQEIPCSEDDFEVAMHLVTTCLKHSFLLSTSLKKDVLEVNELSNPEKIKELLSLLPASFTFSEALQAGLSMHLSRPSVARYLRRACGVYLDHAPRGCYIQRAISDTLIPGDTTEGDFPFWDTPDCPDNSQ